MRLALKHAEFFVLNLRARLPFRYGIASLLAVPHLFCRATYDVRGKTHVGLAADSLVPKWFTKDPDTSYRDDLADMLHVIESAFAFAQQVTEKSHAESVHDLWSKLYIEQSRWAAKEGYPPLLAGLGTSLVERTAIDVTCRAAGVNFAAALRQNILRIQLGELHPELADYVPAELLPAAPLRKLHVRHTVGLSDPLTDAEIPTHEKLADGLPQSLEAAIATYGLTRFKVKLWGDPSLDVQRLRQIAALAPTGSRFTLDGNEHFRDVAPLREFWAKLRSDSAVGPLLEGTLWIEQPLHRDVAFSGVIADDLVAWPDRPPIIIDESDATIGSAEEALDSGYAGTSYKSCKGVIKGIANACLIAHRRREDPAGVYILSAEDLSNVGPIALTEDLAIAASLGPDHLERNGHHYFRGLSMFSPEVQQQVLAHHPDLYRAHPQGFATLNIRDGQIDVGSVIDAPLGYATDLDVSQFTPLDEWSYDTLGV